MKRTPRNSRPQGMTPPEYLHHALLGMHRAGFHPTRPLVVYGNIFIEGMGKSPFSLPPARVVGSVSVKDSPGLDACELSADGALELVGCPSLSVLRGSAASVLLDGVALQSIGADFECHGDMKVISAPSLSRLNCRVGLSLFLRGEVRVSTGPAFSCGVALVLDGGASLVDASGATHGGPPGSPPRLMRGGRFSHPGTAARHLPAARNVRD